MEKLPTQHFEGHHSRVISSWYPPLFCYCPRLMKTSLLIHLNLKTCKGEIIIIIMVRFNKILISSKGQNCLPSPYPLVVKMRLALLFVSYSIHVVEQWAVIIVPPTKFEIDCER